MKKIPFLIVLLLATSLLFGCTSLLPVINTFDITPGTVTAGNSANLVWNVSGANAVTITPGLGILPSAGSQTVNPNVSTAYTISVSSPFGIVSKSVVLVVNPSPIAITLDSNPAVLVSGDSAMLRWNVAGATNITIDQGIGNVQPSGSQIISPSLTTTYTLTASNSSSSLTKSFTVAVNPQVKAEFSASPSTINIGQSSILTWDVSGSDSISIDPDIGQVPASGSRVVTPSSTTSYTLTGKSSCCIISKAAVVNVGTMYPYEYSYGMMNGYPYNYYDFYPIGGMHGFPSPGGIQSVKPFVEIFNVTPNQIKAGQPVLLHWNVVGASTITITGIGNVAYNGSMILTPSATTTYTLTATNAYSSDSRSVTVAIVP